MKKLHLHLQDLQIETFDVVSAPTQRGTVAGHDSAEPGCPSGYTENLCGECYSVNGGITCGCQSYETCTQDPNATECYSDYHGTECGQTCFHCPTVGSLTCAGC